MRTIQFSDCIEHWFLRHRRAVPANLRDGQRVAQRKTNKAGVISASLYDSENGSEEENQVADELESAMRSS